MDEAEATVKFLNDKDLTIEKLENLKLTVIQCADEEEAFDPESFLYNEIDTVLDQAEMTTTYPELVEVITKGKQIEHNVDVLLSKKGRTTLALNWPKTPLE